MYILENTKLLLEFDEINGTLCSLQALNPAWVILDRKNWVFRSAC